MTAYNFISDVIILAFWKQCRRLEDSAVNDTMHLLNYCAEYCFDFYMSFMLHNFNDIYPGCYISD